MNFYELTNFRLFFAKKRNLVYQFLLKYVIIKDYVLRKNKF